MTENIPMRSGPKCGARLRNKPGRTCMQPAGNLTDHSGTGRCWLHGGITAVMTHGRYSQVHRKRIAELYRQHELDPDPYNILPEIALTRALLEDFINRYGANTAALLDWHASYIKQPVGEDRTVALRRTLDEYEILLRQTRDELTPAQADDLALARDTVRRLTTSQEGKPRQILDIADAYKLVDTISKMVERVEHAKAANAISRADMLRVMTEFGRVVQTYVNDPTTLQRIKEGWLSVHL